MIEVTEKTMKELGEAEQNQQDWYQAMKDRWGEREQKTMLSMADPREALMQLPGAMVELTNTMTDLYQIAALLDFGDTWGLKEELLKEYQPKVELDRVHDNVFRLSFSSAVLVLPEEELGKKYKFSNGAKAAYRETIFAQETGRKYRVYTLNRELKDGEFWAQCTESGIRLEARKTGSMWALRLILPNAINGKAVQDFTRWTGLLKGARDRSQHPELARTKLKSSVYYLD